MFSSDKIDAIVEMATPKKKEEDGWVSMPYYYIGNNPYNTVTYHFNSDNMSLTVVDKDGNPVDWKIKI